MKAYRVPANGPKSIEWVRRKTIAKKLLDPSILVKYKEIEFSSNEKSIVGTLEDFVSLYLYRSCVSCKKKVTSDSIQCGNCFKSLKYEEANSDYKLELVVKDQSDNFHYLIAFRSIMKPFEKTDYDIENLTQENLHKLFDSLMSQSARFNYKDLKDDKGLVSIEFMS